jgi:glycerol-3-phosphate acyltransferase PlsX
LSQEAVISLDVMGGDDAPGVIIEGADQALEAHPNVRFVLFGDEAAVRPLLERYPRVSSASEFHHTPDSVSMEDKPSKVLRNGRNTSMWLAINAVKEGKAHAVVSAGNTGALMALSIFQLRTMEGIDRPAITGVWPTMKGRCVVLDLGANVEATAKQLTDFAILGSSFAQVVLHKKDPLIAILNIGEEELKGHDEVREAAAILKDPNMALNFHGFAEGTDIGKGEIDVIVTDGFTGNIALKTAEGTAKLFSHYVKDAFKQSWITKLGAFIAMRAFDNMKERLDPRQGNGGVLLGLNGIVVKSHGGTDATGFANALDVAVEMSESDFTAEIAKTLAHLDIDRRNASDANGDESNSVQKQEVAAE